MMKKLFFKNCKMNLKNIHWD